MKLAREAREAAKHEVLIAGSIGPLGIARRCASCRKNRSSRFSRSRRERSKSAASICFSSKHSATFEELRIALDAIRSFSRLPIVAELTYSEEGTTIGGTRPQEAWEALKEKNIQAVGANCTIGPQLLLPVLRELAGSASLPLSAMPNAGFPKRVGDRTVYPRSSPQYFALFAQEAADLGARIIGGCCGTTPEHIRAIAEAVKKLHPAKFASGKTVPLLPSK